MVEESNLALEQDTYDATSIKVLGGIEAVRKRPAMYIGDTTVRGLHHLVEEVVCNSVDEAIGGFCENINVKINLDGSLTVIDDGRGIPVDTHAETKKSALEVEVRRDEHVYFQRYEKGEVKSPVEVRGVTKKRGTKVIFKPDSEIFEDT